MAFSQIAVPYFYIIFILLYPPQRNRYLFLFFCFLLGWFVDLFDGTGGIHALASLTIGFISIPVIRLVSGMRFFEIEEFSLSDFNPGQWFFYTAIMILVHHFLLNLLESFSFGNIRQVLLRTVFSAVYTSVFVFFYLILFRKKTER
jgi:hypothetical protein